PEQHAGSARLVEEPPLITRPSEAEYEQLAEALDGYLNTLPPHWARILAGYRIVDIAHKVVGVGSVGLRAYVALCEGSSPDDVVFLQLKQARRSVVARYTHGDSAWHRHQGQRVVEYQQALQTVSDPLLGWTTVGDLQFYVRQFRDMKGAILVEDMSAGALADYAGICGYLLAKSHARTSGASMIAGYIGSGDKLEDALSRFARAYADQVESDHAALVAAVRAGVLARRGCERADPAGVGGVAGVLDRAAPVHADHPAGGRLTARGRGRRHPGPGGRPGPGHPPPPPPHSGARGGGMGPGGGHRGDPRGRGLGARGGAAVRAPLPHPATQSGAGGHRDHRHPGARL